MDLDDIMAEMRRKPDAQVLLEWIYSSEDRGSYIWYAVDAYFDAQEED